MNHPLDAVIKTNLTNHAGLSHEWEWLAKDFMDRLNYDCEVKAFDLHMNAVTKRIWDLVLPSVEASFEMQGWLYPDRLDPRTVTRTITWLPDVFTVIENDAVEPGTIYGIQPTVNATTGELNGVEEWRLFKMYGLSTDPAEYDRPGMKYSDVAQLVEPGFLEPKVEGSSPSV